MMLAHDGPSGGPFLRIHALEAGQHLPHVISVDAGDGIGLMIGAALHVGAQFGERLGRWRCSPLRESRSGKQRASKRNDRSTAPGEHFRVA